MLHTADAAVQLATRRKRTGNGWNTPFIGKNRNTIAPGEVPPADGVLYPVAFLVEKDAGAVVKPHFHSADQYQVVVQGGGSVTGPDPVSGGGQYWLVSGGSASVPGGELLSPQSLVFVGPDEAASSLTAGPGGADLICMQFPKRARD